MLELEDIEEQIRQLNNIEAEPSEDHINVENTIIQNIDQDSRINQETIKIEASNEPNSKLFKQNDIDIKENSIFIIDNDKIKDDIQDLNETSMKSNNNIAESVNNDKANNLNNNEHSLCSPNVNNKESVIKQKYNSASLDRSKIPLSHRNHISNSNKSLSDEKEKI